MTAGCTFGGSDTSSGGSAAGTATPTPEDLSKRAAAIAAAMPDEDLVGQVLMPYAYGNDATTVTAGSQKANQRYAGVATAAEMIDKYRLGGMILVGWSADDPTAGTNKTTNVESPTQVRALTSGLQAAAAPLGVAAPILIATDQEYGTVIRIKNGVAQLPTALGLGAGHDPDITQRAWAAAGIDLAAMGVNVDFAPDADVLGDRAGGVIGSRSFGSDPQAVAEQVAAAVRGLEGSGVAATLKHFPGHGQTTADSHTKLPVLGQSRQNLDAVDLAPFVAGIQAKAGLIMSGHLDVRAIDPGVPASFSSKVLIDLLRGELGFSGVVVSDSLNMEPAKQWPVGEAAVRALVAGNDLLLMPPNLEAAQRGLLDGLASGSLPRERLVEAATRVLTLRLRLGTENQPEASEINSGANRDAVAAASAAAVTVFKGPCGTRAVTGSVRVTAPAKRDQQRQWLRAALRDRGVTLTASGGTRVHLVGYGDGSSALAADAAITVAMDTPYVLGRAKSDMLIATYASTQPAMEALADVLAGTVSAPGRSPVAVGSLPRSACER
ncbi:MAG: glycoside hydrolase family 3 [Dactylosporangium sp.]|nr:glycoside hydrolase family 3 [Dactylosporangium sp.]NNJ61177.1 glycoside hydrolase family 3 [Dactylosporangium sp.]